NCEDREALTCPSCHTGILKAKSGEHGDFYGCSNFPYCHFKQKIKVKELYQIAEGKRNAENYESAITYFNKIIKTDGDLQKAYYGRATCYEKRKKYEKAIQDYTVVIEMEPTNKHAFLSRGKCHLALDNKENAWQDWNQAKELGDKRADQLLQKYDFKVKPIAIKEIKVKESFDDRISAIGEAIQKRQKIKFKSRKSISFGDGSRSLRTI